MGSGLVIALDPGTAEAGVAVFEDGELTTAWLSRLRPLGTRNWMLMARQAYADLMERFPPLALEGATVVLEVPQVYRHSVGKDLIKLAQVGGAFAAYIASKSLITVKSYLPREWKGGTKKEVMTERIWGHLTEEEQDRVVKCPRSLFHNVVDACGLGLKQVGRL